MSKKISSKETIERNDKIREFLVANPERLKTDYSSTAKQFKVSPEAVRHICRSLRAKLATVDVSMKKPAKEEAPVVEVVQFKIGEEVLARKENAEIKSLKRQLENAVKDYEVLSDAYDMALALKTQDTTNFEAGVITENYDLDNEATAIVQVSDGHFGEIILPGTVNGLNEYNPDIARKRMDKLAENTITMINKERNGIPIENLVMILGGDFLENSQLHEHSEMTTAMSPMEELLFARELLQKYIKTIAEYGNFKKIVIPCIRGNHARITKKMVSSVDYRMNYEVILYNVLKDEFKDPMFEWLLPQSGIGEFEVYGHVNRVLHGHECKFSSGIGGLTIPLNKYIMRMDQTNPAFYNYIHHYHQYSFPTHRTTLNGSICGLSPYSFGLGFPAEPAIQSFQLLDKKRGMTIKAPIFCD